jgi:hypothetical protein
VVWTPGSGYAVGLARFLDGGICIPPPSPPSNLPPTIGPNAGLPVVPTITTGMAIPDAALTPAFVARGIGSTLALPPGETAAGLALAVANSAATPTPIARQAAPGLLTLPEGLQLTRDKTEVPGTTTGLHSLDLTYFGSGGGGEKERGGAISTSIQDAAFVSLTDDV